MSADGTMGRIGWLQGEPESMSIFVWEYRKGRVKICIYTPSSSMEKCIYGQDQVCFCLCYERTMCLWRFVQLQDVVVTINWSVPCVLRATENLGRDLRGME